MSEQKSDPTQPAQAEVVNSSRRRLTTAALAGPVVLGSLASRQALGAVPYKCTVSGIVSGTQSPRPGDQSCGNLGLSPGCWKQNSTGWTTYTRLQEFNAVFSRSAFPTPTICRKTPVTLIQVLCVQGYSKYGIDRTNAPLARAAVACLLSAAKAGALSSHDYFPLTTTEVITLFQDVFDGNDPIAAATGGSMTALDYMTSLYGGSSSNVDDGNEAACPHTNPTLSILEKCKLTKDEDVLYC